MAEVCWLLLQPSPACYTLPYVTDGTLRAQNYTSPRVLHQQGGKHQIAQREERGLETNKQKRGGLEAPWVNELPFLKCDQQSKEDNLSSRIVVPNQMDCHIAAGSLSETTAQRNKKRGRNSRYLTTEMMLAVLPLSLDFERPESKYCDSPNVIIRVSQLTLVFSLCLRPYVSSL